LRRTRRTLVRASSIAFPTRVALPALSASLEQRTSGPAGRRVPPVNQQSGQGGTRPGVGCGKNQTYNLTAKEIESLRDDMACIV